MEKKLKLGIIGLGTVGTGVVKSLENYKDSIEIKTVAVKNLNKKRDVEVSNIISDPFLIANDPEIDVVVEVAGGVDPQYDVLKTAIQNGKHIVTANKELLAKHGAEIMDLANKHNVAVLYEAAVAGGIPIIMPIKTTLRGNNFSKIAGILNGTTNYILTKMEQENISYQECLKKAQELGYAETDPTGDVEGFDTMYKVAILSNIVFHKRIDVSKVYREGITNISADDIKFAKELGYKIKLIALSQMIDGKIDVRVHPMLVSNDKVISKIDGVLNAVMLEGHPVGEVMFSGPGAGEHPTASSVLGDILAIKAEFEKSTIVLPMTRCNHKEIAEQTDILDTQNSYFISITAKNALGTIGKIGTVCAKHGINLASILQKGVQEDSTATIIVVTEKTSEAGIQNAIKELKDETLVINNLIRVF